MTIESVNQMKVQIKQLFSLAFVALLGLVLYAGSALAQDTSGTPLITTTVTAPTGTTATVTTTLTMGDQMLARFGQDGFNQMVARMTTMHGATVTAQMLAQDATAADCPMHDGTMAGMGMMGQQGMAGMGMMGQQGMAGMGMMGQQNMAGRQGMMGQGRGMMGHGAMAQREMGGMMGGSWLPDWAQQGLHNFMGWGMGRVGANGGPGAAK